jgi:hypothetical protein
MLLRNLLPVSHIQMSAHGERFASEYAKRFVCSHEQTCWQWCAVSRCASVFPTFAEAGDKVLDGRTFLWFFVCG